MSKENGSITPEEHDTLPISGMYETYFLDYASYVILERAVPLIFDGLKPVQRRILHALKVMDDGRFHKVANVIGQTMQYHPHGDQAIGAALVNLGQKRPATGLPGELGRYPYGGPCCCAEIHRRTAFKIRLRCGLQSQNYRMAGFL